MPQKSIKKKVLKSTEKKSTKKESTNNFLLDCLLCYRETQSGWHVPCNIAMCEMVLFTNFWVLYDTCLKFFTLN